jgi:iron complex outermembrane receptor protein
LLGTGQRSLTARLLVVALLAGAGVASASAQDDLSSASLEALTQMQISVSSFARKDEDLWKTPAAVFVITREDIARSSFSSVPELLRMVPGVQVAQLDASTWAVSARGFNSQFAAKVLVLVDGRTVYSEIYSGSHWDQVDLPLEDIERIEVIRGPGAAVWGTNAVNGVINIITRRSRNTLGPLSSGSLSRIGRTANLRYGGTLGGGAQYRAFANFIDRQPFELATGQRAYDGEDTVRAGGRVDWQRSLSDWIILSGDMYKGHLKQQVFPELALPIGPNGQDSGGIAGGYALGRWEHKFRKADMATQVYFDDQSRFELGSDARTRTLDFDYQDHIAAGAHNDVVWGGELRYTFNYINGDGSVLPVTLPTYRNYLVDAFAQDEITLLPGRIFLTLGSKIEQGTLAGFQIQPSARLLWAPSSKQSVWAAISRAAVATSIEDLDSRLPLDFGVQNGLPVTGYYLGNPAFQPETVHAYELGYRRRILTTFTLDLAAFFNDMRRLQSIEPTGAPTFEPTPTPHIEVDSMFTNGYNARAAGVEGSAAWKPQADFSLQVSDTWMQAHLSPTHPGNVILADDFNSPRNALATTASWRFAQHWCANGFLSHATEIPATSGMPVPSYTRLDLHLSRNLGRSLTFDAGGTNLLTPRHLEFGSVTGFVTPSEVPRSLFVKGSWTF